MRRFAIVILATTCVSLFSAWAAEALLTIRIPVIGSFVGLQLAHNPGIAFGIDIPSPWQEIIILCALALVFSAAVRMQRRTFSDIAFGLIIGGALGNLVDRIPDRLVTDFFQVGSFPVFNIADSAITIGAALLIIESLFARKEATSAS